jgi:GNAT superfamily N-acetyltransferase
LAALGEAPNAFGSRLADWEGDGDVEDRWRSRLGIPESHNVVAMLDDQAVGMASGVPTSHVGIVELISMWVAPGARGRGVGDALIGEIERWAQLIGARVLRLSVAAGHTKAASLYGRHEFRYTGELDDLMPDGPTVSRSSRRSWSCICSAARCGRSVRLRAHAMRHERAVSPAFCEVRQA